MRLHLNARERGELHEDEEGADFDSLEDARQEAILSAREMMAERIIAGRSINDIVFEITDERGQVLVTVPWDDVLVRD